MKPHRVPSIARLRTIPSSIRPLASIPRTHIPSQQCRHASKAEPFIAPPNAYARDKPFRFSKFDQAVAEELKLNSSGRVNPLDYVRRQREKDYRALVNRRRLLAAATLALTGFGLSLFYYFNYWDPELSKRLREENARQKTSLNVEHLDAPSDKDVAQLEGRNVVVKPKPGDPAILVDEEGIELHPTGSGTAPYFRRVIALPTGDNGVNEEYSLIGVGRRHIRAVFAFEVYVVGLYVRTSDLNSMQNAFVKLMNPTASSLIPNEKTQLREKLLDDTASFELWDAVLKESGAKTMLRIEPTRKAQFSHLRDGWVRGITSRAQAAAKNKGKDSSAQSELETDDFGAAIKKFKNAFAEMKDWGPPVCEVNSKISLVRDGKTGLLTFFYEQLWNPEKTQDKEGNNTTKRPPPAELIGSFDDERVSRQVVLLYLGGKDVSSEEVRKNVVEGVIELVGRPVGTLITQVI